MWSLFSPGVGPLDREEGLGDRLKGMIMRNTINDGEASTLDEEGSDEIDLLLFPLSFFHLANDEGLFA
jgi:hypothetical protein